MKYVKVVLEVEKDLVEEWVESKRDDFRVESNVNEENVVYLKKIEKQNCLLMDGHVTYGDDMIRLKPWENQMNSNHFYETGDLKINFYTGIVYKGDQLLHLPNTLMILLECLVTNANHILTRHQLLTNLESISRNDIFNNSLNVYIYRLRKHLGKFEGRDYILTHNGLGYTWNFEIK